MKSSESPSIRSKIPYWARSHESQENFYITSWFNKKNSYVQLYQQTQTDTLSVGDEAIFDVKIKASNEMENHKLYFQIQSLINVQIVGYYDFVAKKTILSSNYNDIDVQVELVNSSIELLEHKPKTSL